MDWEFCVWVMGQFFDTIVSLVKECLTKASHEIVDDKFIVLTACAVVVTGFVYPFLVACDSIRHQREISRDSYQRNVFLLLCLGCGISALFVEPFLSFGWSGWAVGWIPGAVLADVIGDRLVTA